MQSRKKIDSPYVNTPSIQSVTSSNTYNRRIYKENNSASNNYRVVDKKKESNTPYKIIINTRYDKCHKNPSESKNDSKEENKSKTHIHILTTDERKKYGRGIRPSAAQREMDAYAKLDNKTKDSMIEVIDKTKYPLENPNIKLKPNNKTTLINKKKLVVSNEPRQRYVRGIREKKEEIIGEIEVNERPSGIRNANNNQNQNKDIKLISNKRIVIRNKRPLSPNANARPNALPSNYDQKRNLTKKVEKSTTRTNNMNLPDTTDKNKFRHNTVSHKIVDIKKGERKPYVLNERKTDKISFHPNAFMKYKATNNKDKNEPYKNNKNHSIIVTRNVTREYKTVADIPNTQKVHHRYNFSQDPNLKNTGSHKIDATKKEPKKEVKVHPRNLIVIKSVIPSRRHLTEISNENSGQKKNQNLFVRKYETDKKNANNLNKKFEIARENKYNLQKPQNQPNIYQPKLRISDNKIINKNENINNTRINRRINDNEPKKEPAKDRLNKPVTTTKPQTIATKPPTLITKPQTTTTKPQTIAIKPPTLITKPQTMTTKPQTITTKPPTSITKPQTTQQVPSYQINRQRREYQKPAEKPTEKPSENKNQPQSNTITSSYSRRASQPQTQTKPQPVKPTQSTTVRPSAQPYKYTPPSNTNDANKNNRRIQQYQISSQHRISSSGADINSQPVNRRQEQKLDNNEVKQVVYKKNSNISSNPQNDKTKNYAISNARFVQNNDNNGFVISKANKTTNSTAINYNVNKNENKDYKINKDIKPREIISKVEVKIESKEEKPIEQKVEKEEEKKLEPEQKVEPEKKEEQEEVKAENEEIQNNENTEDKNEEINIEVPVEEHIEKQENINEDNNNQNEQQETENKVSTENIIINQNIEDSNEPKQEILSEENPNEIIEINQVEEINVNKAEESNENNEQINPENKEEENNEEHVEEEERDQEDGHMDQNEVMISNEYNMNINNIENENEEGNQYEEGGEEGEEQIENVENAEAYENEDLNYQEHKMEVEEGEGEEEQNQNGQEYININENGEEYENINENGEEYAEVNEEENGENYEEAVGEQEIQEIDGGEEDEVDREAGVDEIEDREGEGDDEEQ